MIVTYLVVIENYSTCTIRNQFLDVGSKLIHHAAVIFFNATPNVFVVGFGARFCVTLDRTWCESQFSSGMCKWRLHSGPHGNLCGDSKPHRLHV
jgi:hypothetical protein